MTDYKPKNPTMQVRTPLWMRQAVQEIAHLQGVSESEILRQAIHQYLSNRDITPPGLKAPVK